MSARQKAIDHELRFLRGHRLQLAAALVQVDNRIEDLGGTAPLGPTCPSCNATGGVIAEADDRYVCGECDTNFGAEGEVIP